jgi:hypothetical protein
MEGFEKLLSRARRLRLCMSNISLRKWGKKCLARYLGFRFGWWLEE